MKEVASATEIKTYDKRKGIYKVLGGHSYIQIARFGKDGPDIQSVSIYGVSNKPNRPIFNHRMEMFNAHQFKSMQL